jgi:uncharacterized membrane protein
VGTAEALRTWHDFFLLMGGASATLVGLVFVTVSLATSLPKLPRGIDRMLFTSPIVAQYGYAVGLCAVSVIPFTHARYYALTIVAAGLTACLQMTWLVRNLFRRHAEQTVTPRYWAWSAAVPFVAALLLLGSGAWMLRDDTLHVGGVAAAVMVLALAGVRNSWMLVSWFFDERERHAQARENQP